MSSTVLFDADIVRVLCQVIAGSYEGGHRVHKHRVQQVGHCIC